VDNWKAYLGAALAALGMLFQGARWVGTIENRIEQLEQKDRYLHGSYPVPNAPVK
jgi:hypothetical protein